MYIYVWEYSVLDVNRKAFERAYGKGGDWERLFTGKDGYIKTEFFMNERGVYLTIDHWESKEKLKKFQEEYKVAIDTIDKKCDELTESEILLGEFRSL
jgi:serine protease inhibitor